MDIAQLGMRVDSRPIDRATDSMRRFSRQGAETERRAKGIERAGSALAASWTRMLGPLAAIGGAVSAAFSTRPIFEFQNALAEVSTLVDTAAFDMRGLRNAALEQTAAFGGSAAGQVKAFYQIISAGASTAAEATEILTAANRLAVGGVTDVKTAADGLTSVLNAYGDRVQSATAVSDALFVGMRAGKTTIGELSGSLGKVAPLAAQTGVSFDELVAAISALTKGGIATTEAVTGVRAILAAVAKPTSEAVKQAKALGLNFSAAALEAQGFAGFLGDVVQKTGGSTAVLSQLFGGVEALVPIMALAGQAGTDFNAILEQMGVKAGATQEAFEKMANSPGFQAGRVWAALQVEVIRLGGAMGSGLVPVMRVLADNMDRLVTTAVTAAAIIGGRYAIALALAAARTVTLSAVLVTLRGVMLRLPFVALVVAAGELVLRFSRLVRAAGGFGEAMTLLGNVAVEVWDRITLNAAAMAVALQGRFEQIKSAFLSALQVMAGAWSEFLTDVAAVASKIPGLDGVAESVTNGMVNAMQAATALGNKAAAASAKASELAGSAAELARQSDAPLKSIQALRDAVANSATSMGDGSAAADRLGSALGSAGAAIDGASGKAGKLSEEAKAAAAALDEMKSAAEQWTERTATPIERYSAGVAELNALLSAGLVSHETMRRGAQLLREELQQATPAWQEARDWIERTRTPTERYAEQVHELNALLRAGAIDMDTYGRATEMLHDEMVDAESAAARTGGTFGGMLDPMKRALSDGEMSFKSFADAVVSIGRRMADQLLDQAFKPIEQALANLFSGGGGASGGGGIFGAIGSALFGGGGGATPFTFNPGDFGSVGTYADGGVARGWSVVGERGPELVNFDAPARVYSNADSQKMVGGGEVTINQNYTFRGTINRRELEPILERKKAETVATIQELRREDRRFLG